MPVSLANAIFNNSSRPRTKVQFATRVRKRITLRLRRFPREALEPHGGLPFKRCLAGKASQGSGRIKKPSHRSCGEGAHIFARQALSVVITDSKRKGLSRDIRQVMQLFEESCRGLDWIRRSRVSTGQHCAPQMSDAFEPGTHAAGKNLPAPDAVVITVASPVEANRDDTLVPRTAFANYRSNVRAMMLNCSFLGGLKFQSMQGRYVLRMCVMHDQ